MGTGAVGLGAAGGGAFESLRPGGFVLVRQLNSSLDVRGAGERFDWLAEGDTWLGEDRSFFYRRLHLGRKA